MRADIVFEDSFDADYDDYSDLKFVAPLEVSDLRVGDFSSLESLGLMRFVLICSLELLYFLGIQSIC